MSSAQMQSTTIQPNVEDPEGEPKDDSTGNPVATRFCFRLRVEDIPGVPLARSITLANDFLTRNFHRKFSWDQDYVYTPVNIGDEGKAWILLDVNKNMEPKPALQDVELVVFRVKVVGDSMCDKSPPSQVLIYCDMTNFHFASEYNKAHYADIRRYTSIFPWGGRG